MTLPLLSIIIPCYNVQDYVQEALQSILDNTSQTNYQLLELIIVNDGSTDQTFEEIQAFISKLDNKYINYAIINQANAGLSAARNAGMMKARGEYWLFLDSDDIFTNQAIDKILSNIEKYQPDIIEFDATKFSDNVFEKQGLYVNFFKKLANLDVPSHRLMTFEENRWYVWSRCYHKKVFTNQTFEIGKLFEDMMIIPYCYLVADKITIIPESLVGYRQRASSILATLSHRHLEDLVFGIDKAIEAESKYHEHKQELAILQYKNWRLVVAESIKKTLKTHDFSYLKNMETYRRQLYQKYNRDYGWQIGYLFKVLVDKKFKIK